MVNPLQGRRGHTPPLLLVLASLLGLVACSRPAPPPEPVRSVRTMVVAASQAGAHHEFAAEIRARSETRLGFRVGGKMVSRSAEVGQRVKAGEVLARLDPEDLRLSQQAAAAAVQAAQVNHDLSQADFKRYQELRAQGFISGAELERREATLKSAAAQLAQARAQAAVQGNQATYAALVAPAAGVVVAVEAEPGTVLAAGAPVLRLALDGPRDAVFAVPEQMVTALRTRLGKPGAVRVKPWSGGEPLPATVREVAAAADAVTRTFLVKADLPAGNPLQLGQTASVMLDDAAAAEAVLLLPSTAVRELQGRSVVWVVDAQRQVVQSRPIAVAGAQGNQVMVSGGLKAGERVVTAGVHVLVDGQPVRVAASAASAAPAASAASR